MIGIILAFQFNPPHQGITCGFRVVGTFDSSTQQHIAVAYTMTITVISVLKKIVFGARVNLKIKQSLKVVRTLTKNQLVPYSPFVIY
jgi:hypothetical protein